MADADNPLGFLFGGSDDLSAAMHRFADLLAWRGGAVNWDLAREIASRSSGDDPPSAATRSEVADALRLADLWLDEVTTMSGRGNLAEAWTPQQWIRETLSGWSALVDPVAQRVVDAMDTALPDELRAAAGPLSDVMRRLGGLMFGAQVGQALAGLAGEVLSASDVGVPLSAPGRAALVPANVASFGAGLGVPQTDVFLYVALREAAHQRLFASVPWVKSHLFDAVDAYARGITIDTTTIERAMHEIDPNNPDSLQEVLGSGLFEPTTTPAQQAALRRLETALALVEGWVDNVVAAAADAHHMPSASALRETVNRRRASGGPAEQTFATLVGLELRPRRLREAATLWRAVDRARGSEQRDALWAHPDLLPSGDDLDDPEGFASREQASVDVSDFDMPPDVPREDGD